MSFLTIRFRNPPIVELSIGIQFSLLTQFTAGHFGLFWKELGEEWEEPNDAPPIEDQYESFEEPRWRVSPRMGIKVTPFPVLGRFILRNRSRDRLLQIQPTRFQLNWKKHEAVYPKYESIFREFERFYGKFRQFVEEKKLGPLIPNHWELTYIDAFAEKQEWNSPSDWHKILPGLFPSEISVEDIGLFLEHRKADCSFEIRPNRGRVYIGTGIGRVEGDPNVFLLLRTTVRGPIDQKSLKPLQEYFDLGHKVAVEVFLRIVSEEAKKRWE